MVVDGKEFLQHHHSNTENAAAKQQCSDAKQQRFSGIKSKQQRDDTDDKRILYQIGLAYGRGEFDTGNDGQHLKECGEHEREHHPQCQRMGKNDRFSRCGIEDSGAEKKGQYAC